MEGLYETIKALAQQRPARFHMPGNKGRDYLSLGDGFLLDMTELPQLDNLFQPQGVLALAQRQMAECFGAEESFFLVNGSSCGIMAAVMAACGEGETLICARNSHVSLFRAMALSGARPAYVYPAIAEGIPLCGGLSPAAVAAAMGEHPNARAIFITCPTYEGITSDISKIAKMAHAQGMLLIVDEAHGAHFGFSDYFPATALAQGADVVIQSHHKTLASLGQTAVLHVQGTLADREKIKTYLAMLQTTSPSYLLMASLDRNRALLHEQGGDIFAQYVSNLEALRKALDAALGEVRGARLLDISVAAQVGAADLDRGKLVLLTPQALRLDSWLREERQIYSEMSGRDAILFMTSYADTAEDYERLHAAIDAYFGAPGRREPAETCCESAMGEGIAALYTPPKSICTPKEGLGRQTAMATLDKAVGRVSGSFITPYPPGIPAIVPGEELSAALLAQMGGLLNAGQRVLGIEQDEKGQNILNVFV